MPKCLCNRDMVVVLLLAIAGSVGGCQRQAQEWAVVDEPDSLPAIEVTSEHPPPPLTPEVVAVSPSATLEPLPAKPPVKINTYTIRRLDTLWSIAQRTYGDGKRWRDIVRANDGLDPTKLRVGQKIVLP